MLLKSLIGSLVAISLTLASGARADHQWSNAGDAIAGALIGAVIVGSLYDAGHRHRSRKGHRRHHHEYHYGYHREHYYYGHNHHRRQ